jgi:hypothetical protein
VKLSRIDLNLLVALDALLAERSVTLRDRIHAHAQRIWRRYRSHRYVPSR